jgi:hypothetical protein
VADEITTEDDVSNQYFSLQNPSRPANKVFSCLPGRITYFCEARYCSKFPRPSVPETGRSAGLLQELPIFLHYMKQKRLSRTGVSIYLVFVIQHSQFR